MGESVVTGGDNLSLQAMDESFHSICRIFRTQDGSADGYAVNARCHDGRYVVNSNAAYGAYRQTYAFFPHTGNDIAEAFKPQQWRQVLFGRGEAERAATDVVGCFLFQPSDVFQRVGCSAYQIFLAQEPSRFGNGHVVVSQMDTVCIQFLDQFDTVVYDENRTLVVAMFQYPAGYRFHFVVRGIFHAELYPSATTLQCQQCGLFV